MPDLEEIMEPLLTARQKLREEFASFTRKCSRSTTNDEICRRLMTIPGVGPIVALAFSRHDRHPGAVQKLESCRPGILGLTPKLNESGESSRVGCISLCGDAMMRTLLYEAAQTMLTRTTKWSWLKAWAMKSPSGAAVRRQLSRSHGDWR